MIWAGSLVAIGLIDAEGDSGFLLGFLLLLMPALGTFPAVLRFFFRPFSIAVTALCICGIVALLSSLFWFDHRLADRQLIALIAPFYQLAIFLSGYFAFFRFLGREPVDVVFNFSDDLFWDRVFMIFSFLAAFMVPFYFLLPPQVSP